MIGLRHQHKTERISLGPRLCLHSTPGPACCQWQAEAARPARDISMAATLLMKATCVGISILPKGFFPL